MYNVNVQNSCSCFIKSGLAQTQMFDTKEEAKAKAQELIAHMSNKFCQKHEFVMNERFGDFTIFIKPRG